MSLSVNPAVEVSTAGCASLLQAGLLLLSLLSVMNPPMLERLLLCRVRRSWAPLSCQQAMAKWSALNRPETAHTPHRIAALLHVPC